MEITTELTNPLKCILAQLMSINNNMNPEVCKYMISVYNPDRYILRYAIKKELKKTVNCVFDHRSSNYYESVKHSGEVK